MEQQVQATWTALALLAAAQPGNAEADGAANLTEPDPVPLGIALQFGCESRYVSEGRSNLDGDGLAGTTAEATHGALGLGVCYLSSPNTDYTELQFGASLAADFGDLSAYVGCTHLEFLADDEDDNEVGAGLAYKRLPADLALELDATYSVEAEGAFFEASLGGEYAALDWLSFSPAVALGFNAGYVADGHDGANHVAATLGIAATLREGLALEGYVAYTWGIDAEPDTYAGDESLDDTASAGLALRCEL